MARIRTIKPTHVNDKELANVSLQAHLLWVLSWCFSDDEGVIENDPLLLRSQIFPRRTDIRIEQVQQWIDQLIKARFVIPFDHEGQGYLLHRTFQTHQKIDRPQASKIPSEIIRRTLDECSTNVRPCIVEESRVKESKGEERPASDSGKNLSDKKNKGQPAAENFTNPFSDSFLHYWDIWKQFKKDQFRFTYKSVISEQAAVMDLVNLSGGKEETAVEIIKQSIAKGWKGFFELKNNNNGFTTTKQATGAGVSASSAFDKIDTMLGKAGG
jgi:hypothetical protein